MQTILGAGGVIGTELARSLGEYTKNIRLVSRHPVRVNPTDELMVADLLNREAVSKAVEGSEIVYVTVGFAYKLKVWQSFWPTFMDHVVRACKTHGAKLVFFDNIYMYDAAHLNPMTEETPVNPPSEKGKVRGAIAQMLLEEVRKGQLVALIARSADFYGPGLQNTSMLTQTVIKPLSQGKPASWFGGVGFRHSFTFTPDAGKATALLGNTPDAYNQVWHLPTAAAPWTGQEWIRAIAGELGVKPVFRRLPKGMLWLLGWFVPILKEMREMMYQYDRDYVFDSSKFEKRFGWAPTPYAVGVVESVKAYR